MWQWYEPDPYGVLPEGNLVTKPESSAIRFGTLSPLVSNAGVMDFGKGLTQSLSPVMCEKLLPFLEVNELALLARVSTGFYVLCHVQELWKEHVISHCHGQALCFVRNWKTTAVRSASRPVGKKRARLDSFVHCPIRVHRPFHSDVLFQSWLCALVPPTFGLVKAGASLSSRLLPVERIRVNDDGASFLENFEKPHRPCIIADGAVGWKLFQKLNLCYDNIATHAEDIFRDPATRFRCESVEMDIRGYVDYSKQQRDERPIYLFDPTFVEAFRDPSCFEVPSIFDRDDFFKVLGASRPNYRWLIVGPVRGGSSFHVDPNYTSAWNACLTGKKRWIFFPPHVTPPGVFTTADMSQVATPSALTEWFLNYYNVVVEKYRSVAYECICEAGDIVYVPCGWWHCVINLEDSVAITQNFVSRFNLREVFLFLEGMTASISGIGEEEMIDDESLQQRKRDFGQRFESEMRKQFPDVAVPILEALAEEKRVRQATKSVKAELSLAQESNGFHFEF